MGVALLSFIDIGTWQDCSFASLTRPFLHVPELALELPFSAIGSGYAGKR
jgi:hypothetical protein